MLICTDSAITYQTVHIQKDRTGAYPILLNKIRKIAEKPNVTLTKVKGHAKPDVIPGNEVADILADTARDFGHNNIIETPNLSSYLNSSLTHCYAGCSEVTTSWADFDVG